VRAGWLAGGLAASVAAFALVALGPRNEEPDRGAAAVPAVAQNMPVASRPLGAERMTSYLVFHSNYTTAPFRGTLNSHLVAGRAERARWYSAEDFRNGR
jgi:hypothetical protein